MNEGLRNNSEKNDDLIFKTARAKAVRILSRFERSDSYIDKLLDYELKSDSLNQLDKSLLTEIVNGVIRWRLKLDWVLVGFYIGDYLKCLNIIKNSMRVALYQILFLDKIPPPSAINESVELVKRIQGDRIAGVVNGVLRNIMRNLESIRFPEREDDPAYYFSVLYSHPKWMVKRWIDRFGEDNTEKLLIENNQRPYMALRVNSLVSTVENIQKIFNERRIPFFYIDSLPNTLIIKTPKFDISAADFYNNGSVAVQDPSATLAAMLSNAKEGNFVIDLCAAPGGKSYTIAEMMNDKGRILAIDKYSAKIDIINKGAKRLGLNSISTLVEDSTSFQSDELADIVFVDAPCSGLGTLTKKPDIKWKREVDDIFNLVEIQRNILFNAASLVKPGGVLIYSTCTMEYEENQANIEWFLHNFSNFELDIAELYLSPEYCLDGFLQTFPFVHRIDGAFAARLVRIE